MAPFFPDTVYVPPRRRLCFAVFCSSVCLPDFRELLEGIGVATESNGVQSRKTWGVNIFEKVSSTTPTEDKYLQKCRCQQILRIVRK